jgi:type I restriction enzyme M protein
VSLPAGVFNPYSGVKTSILILDKRLAKMTDSVLFVKVENDGYNLGAQRRAVTGSGLPEAVRRLRAFFADAVAFENNAMAHKVERTRIGENGEWSLSGERYVAFDVRQSNFDLCKLSDVCYLIGGSTPSKSEPAYWTEGSIKWISSKHISDFRRVVGYELITQRAVDESSTKVAPKGSTILITRVSVGKYALADDDYAINQDLTALISRDENKLDPGYLFHIAGHLAEIVEKNAQGIGVRGVTRSFLSDLTIPVPPLAIQQEIVTEIEGYQKRIEELKSGIGENEAKIKTAINRVWGDSVEAPSKVLPRTVS